MGKGKNDGDLLGVALFVIVGSVVLHYIQTGKGEENDAPFIPDPLEGQIDDLVAALNHLVGKPWVDVSLERLKFYLERALPPHAVVLVNLLGAVYTAELMARGSITPMTGRDKQQAAARLIRGY